MTIYFAIVFFILGLLFGSFYNVVAYRLPKKESIFFPSSHCVTCGHKLTALELIPVFSYLIQRGRCKNCREKISSFYTWFELLTALLFLLSYLLFGFSIELIISLIFVSACDIIIITDYKYMIILDEVLIISGVLIAICIYIRGGYTSNTFNYIEGFKCLGLALTNGILAFATMYGIKKFGDFLFKKDSMGGGDIKLLGFFGMVLGYVNSILIIGLGSIIALPITIFILKAKRSEETPFGPFLVAAALILFLSQFNIMNFYRMYY